MTTTTKHDTEVDGIKLSVQITAIDEGGEQDPAMVRDFVNKLSRDVEKAINSLGDVNSR